MEKIWAKEFLRYIFPEKHEEFIFRFPKEENLQLFYEENKLKEKIVTSVNSFISFHCDPENKEEVNDRASSLLPPQQSPQHLLRSLKHPSIRLLGSNVVRQDGEVYIEVFFAAVS